MNENQRTITLPTIPKEVADAIENYRLNGFTDESILDCTNISEVLRSIPFSTLMSALINGYVSEMTAEELKYEGIRRKYEEHRYPGSSCADIESECHSFANGILFTLDTLGIKIEGVNA